MAWSRMIDGIEQGVFGDAQQLHDFRLHGSHGNACGVVADPAVFDDADIDFHDVTIGDDAISAANSVDDFVVDADTDLAREIAVSKESTTAADISHKLSGGLIDLQRAHSGPNQSDGLSQDLCSRVAAESKGVDLLTLPQWDPFVASFQTWSGTAYFLVR